MKYDESALLKIGNALWRECYGDNTHNDRRAQEVVHGRFKGMPSGMCGTVRVHDKQGHYPDYWGVEQSLPDTLMFAAKWIDGGCRTLTSDPKYFAAMAQTRAEGAAQDLRIPWPAFVVNLPPGLIVDGDGVEYCRATFAQYKGVEFLTPDSDAVKIVESVAYYSIDSELGVSIHARWPNWTLVDILCNPDPVKNEKRLIELGDTIMEQTGSDDRIRELVKRATVGLLYTMQHTDNWRHGGHFDRPGHGAKLRSGPPPHRTIIIGRPISIDVREAVRQDAMAGSRAAPSVQTLVRGHLKRQVVGPGGSARKVIWVEPYWRGPEDAAILARPTKIVPSDTSVSR